MYKYRRVGRPGAGPQPTAETSLLTHHTVQRSAWKHEPRAEKQLQGEVLLPLRAIKDARTYLGGNSGVPEPS